MDIRGSEDRLALRESGAALHGFERKACPKCHNMTLRRLDAVLTCASCKSVVYELSESQWLRHIRLWWNLKPKLYELLLVNAMARSEEWQTVHTAFMHQMLEDFKGAVERAENPERCLKEFCAILNYLARPVVGRADITVELVP